MDAPIRFLAVPAAVVDNMAVAARVLESMSDKLANVMVVINCPYSVAQMFTREERLAHNLGRHHEQ